jgi:ketosteroid isomerase-like protein
MPHEEGHPGNRSSDATLSVLRKAMSRSEPIRGKAALAERYSQPDAQSWDITSEAHDMLANDEHGVALITATATKPSGEPLTYKVAEIYHVKDGKISARWAFSDDTEEINRFFGGT